MPRHSVAMRPLEETILPKQAFVLLLKTISLRQAYWIKSNERVFSRRAPWTLQPLLPPKLGGRGLLCFVQGHDAHVVFPTVGRMQNSCLFQGAVSL